MELNLNKEELLKKSKEEIIDILFEIILHLYQENQALKAENKKLRKEIDELRKQLNLPKKDSNNSSKPPSTDNKRSKAKHSRKKKGPPKGHQAFHKELSDTPDEVKNHWIEECPYCGRKINSASTNYVSRQWIELDTIKIKIIEERRQTTTCSHCLKTIYAPIGDSPVPPKKHIVPYLKTFISLLHYKYGVSRDKIRDFISTYSGSSLSLGSIDKITKELSKASIPICEMLTEKIKSACEIGIDETGWRVNGENQWAWVFENQDLTYYVIKPSRGSMVPKSVLGEDFQGIILSDFYSAYSPLLSGGKAKCISHLIRDLEYGIQVEGNQKNGFCRNVLNIVLDALFLRKLMELLSDTDVFQYHRSKLEQRFENELNRNLNLAVSQKLQKRLNKYRNDIFYFLYDLNVPPTSNGSEQALRKIVIHRKRSNGSRSQIGADAMARIMTVIETCKKQSWNVVDFIYDLFRADNIKDMIYDTS